MSAQSAVFHAARSHGFTALVLFDPFICPPRVRDATPRNPQDDHEPIGQEHPAPKGNIRYREAFAERIRNAPAFERLVPEAADLIARTTLRPIPRGTGYELRCPRNHEAKIYEQGLRWATTVEIDRLPCPTKAIGTDPAVPFSFMPTVDLRELLILDYDFVPETTHFL